MARPRNRAGGTVTAERDPSRVANNLEQLVDFDPAPRVLPQLPINNSLEVRSHLPDVEDLRVFRPDGAATPPRSTRRWSVKIKLAPASKAARLRAAMPASYMMFASPKYVAVCVRRAARKEVLHALGKVGRGAKTSRLRRRSTFSNVRC